MWAIDWITFGAMSGIWEGMPESSFTAFSIMAAAACISSELRPVMMRPSFSWMAAPETISPPALPLPASFAFCAAWRAASTGMRSSGLRPSFCMSASARATESRSVVPRAKSVM